MCKDDYPPILTELEKGDFEDLLDVGCGTGPMIELLASELPGRHYTGLDLTPKMIEVADAKRIEGAHFVVGDAENLPFDDASFDAVICANSFHHYPNPQAFLQARRGPCVLHSRRPATSHPGGPEEVPAAPRRPQTSVLRPRPSRPKSIHHKVAGGERGDAHHGDSGVALDPGGLMCNVPSCP